MIKGCTKRVIVVKDVSSDIFEEAYFILRPSSEKNHKPQSRSDILKEANRIVASRECDSTNGNTVKISAGKPKRAVLRDAAFFVFGFFVAAGSYGLYYLL